MHGFLGVLPLLFASYLYLLSGYEEVWAYECSQRLYEAKGDPTTGSNGFAIEVTEREGNGSQPTGYVPGRMYKIALKGRRTQYFVQTYRGFSLTSTFESNNRSAGHFDVKRNRRDRGDFRVSPSCRSAGVSHSNLRPKTEVFISWRAPETSTDCVVFRAAIVQSRFVWYLNENELTKRFCIVDNYQKVLPKDDPSAECCACDEADYDVEFIGIWSKESHPKDYPSLEHLTHFTDMLGAAHSQNYSLWRFGDTASDGLKEIAEWGNTYKAEAEMKANASEIRTIVKMKGLWYPEVQSRSQGRFHVNKYHHLASLACMFGPSPDWCVGVSAINLCLPDCSWVEERAFDLKPFDAGTDSGPTYMSPNSPQEPRIAIAPITTKSDSRSPFYDPASDEIAPLARLILKRKQVVQSRCKSEEDYRREAFNVTNTSEDEEYKDRRECSVREWEPWSLCSATCGKGIRMRSRVFEFPVKAQMFHCHRQVTERQFCNARINECEGSEAFNSRCTVTGWASWSECTVTCGKGTRRRERQMQDPTQASSCSVELSGMEQCIGDNGEDCSVEPNPLCKTTSWSDWSPCSASCDDGVRVRTRLFYYAEHEHECPNNLVEKETCNVHSCRRLLSAHSEGFIRIGGGVALFPTLRYASEICEEEKMAGQCGGQFPKYWFNSATQRCERFTYTGCKGNRNQFDTEEECKSFCIKGYKHDSAIISGHQLIVGSAVDGANDGGPAVACDISEWASWSDCSVTCGKGKRQRSKTIRALPRNGGIACPPSEQLIQIRNCELRPCPPSCRAGQWSRWSACSVSCGTGYQTRRRRISRNHIDLEMDEQNCSLKELEQRACRMPCRH